MLPDPVHALSIFVNVMIAIMHFWLGKHNFGFLHASVSVFLIYLQYYKYSKSKSKE
jgi:hypothetical protein